MNIEEIKQKLKPIFEKNGVISAAIFGSYARGEKKPNADLDLLLKTENPLNLEEYFTFLEEMKGTLGIDVDITFDEYVNPFMRQDINAEKVPIYG